MAAEPRAWATSVQRMERLVNRPRFLTELAFWFSFIVVLALIPCAIGYLVTCLVDWLL